MLDTSNEERISEHVAEKVLQAYVFPYKHMAKNLTQKQIDHFLKARAKNDEFNVLSGLVYWNDDDLSTMKLLTLTTGVKCMPDIKLNNTEGRIVHDMHAEILSIRALSWFMLDEMKRVKEGEMSDLIEFVEKDENCNYFNNNLNGKFKLKKNIKFALYISELPCGDCSLEELGKTDSKSWDRTLNKENLIDSNKKRKLKGGELFNYVGIVRTKPGRKDSPICSSKSCSDKLAVISYCGIMKSIITDLIVDEKVKLDYIVLPQNKFEGNENSIKRCFNERLNFKEEEVVKLTKVLKCPDFIIEKFSVILKEKNLGIMEIDRERKRKAAELSLICILQSGQFEIINKGIKNGHNIKSIVKSTKGVSFLSRYSLFQKRNNLENNTISSGTYYSWKKRKENENYTKRMIMFKTELGYWWNDEKGDDFDLTSVTKFL